MRAAWKMTSAIMNRPQRSSREGTAEMFTLQRLQLPPSLYKCVAATNLIESPRSGVACRIANVKY
jgi:hypothetical protein